MSDSSDIDEMLMRAISQRVKEGDEPKKSRSHHRGTGSQQRRDDKANEYRRKKAEEQLLRENAFGRGMECMSIFDPQQRMDCMVGERGSRGAVVVGRGAVVVGRANSSGSEGYPSALEEEEEEPPIVAAEPPELLCDKIDNEFFEDPVVTAEGFTHSRGLVEAWFTKSDISPDTGRVMDDKTLRPNILVRQMVDAWKEANPGYKEGGFINKKARKSRRKSRSKKNRSRRSKSKSRK